MNPKKKYSGISVLFEISFSLEQFHSISLGIHPLRHLQGLLQDDWRPRVSEVEMTLTHLTS